MITRKPLRIIQLASNRRMVVERSERDPRRLVLACETYVDDCVWAPQFTATIQPEALLQIARAFVDLAKAVGWGNDR